MIEIAGRDEGSIPKQKVYKAKLPLAWHVKEREDSSTSDSKIPLATFFNHNNSVKITVHNFPSNHLKERIPPSMQVDRWQKQFDSIDPVRLSIKQIASNGFQGLFFEAEGLMGEEKVTILAWALQLHPPYYSHLNTKKMLSKNKEEIHYLKQMQADYTIKAIGSTESMNQCKEEILFFAKHFELIDEINE